MVELIRNLDLENICMQYESNQTVCHKVLGLQDSDLDLDFKVTKVTNIVA